MRSRSIQISALLGAICVIWSCGGERVEPQVARAAGLQPPSFDDAFRRIWDDGKSEVTRYKTVRLRAGTLHNGSATVVLRRATYSEDDRVLVTSAKPTETDLFPVMQMVVWTHDGDGLDAVNEMTTSVLAFSSVNGRVAGSETKTDYSLQSAEGQLFHQLVFDATGVRSHQYSYFESEGDEQITLPYPNDGVSGDALWFWARHMAAPSTAVAQSTRVHLLSRLRDSRGQHRSISWKPAVLTRETDRCIAKADDGTTETFTVEPALPFRVLHWENSQGERADLVDSQRIVFTNVYRPKVSPTAEAK